MEKIAMNRRLILTIFALVLNGCASLKFSKDLKNSENVVYTQSVINKKIGIIIKKTNSLESSKDNKKNDVTNEIQTVMNSKIFANPEFLHGGSKNDSQSERVEIEITREFRPGFCYLGGCMIIPTTSTLQFSVKFMVYDSKNTRIYEDTDEIKGSLWGNIGTLYYGFRPLNDFDQNGASFLIKELLFRFQASDEFKLLQK